MKSAVEWLTDLLMNGYTIDNKVIQQAKEMEKQQIVDAYDDGQRNPYEYSEDLDVNWYDGRRYYNQTFSE